MSLQNILGNMLSGLAGQMAKGQGKGEMLGMEGLSEEFAGAFRQAVEQLSVLKAQNLKASSNPEQAGDAAEADMLSELSESDQELVKELTELVAIINRSGEGTLPEADLLPTDLMETGNSAEPVGDTNSQDDLTMGVMPEGTDAAGLTEDKTLPLQKASPQAKAILAELMTVWSAQMPTATTVPVADVASRNSDPAGLKGFVLPKMPGLPPEVRTMLTEKGFTFEAAQADPEADPDLAIPAAPVDAKTLEKTTEKETVNNPASSKAGEAAALSDASLPPTSFSLPEGQETAKQALSQTPAAAKLPEQAKVAESGTLQTVTSGSKESPATEATQAGQKALEALKNILETAPEQAKPALQQVLDKLQSRPEQPGQTPVTSDFSSELTVQPSEAVVEPEAAPAVTAEGAVRMAGAATGQNASSSPVTASVTGLDSVAPADMVIPTTPGPSGRDSLSLKGMAGTSPADQVVNAASFSVQNGRKEVTLQLNPHELGDVRVRLSSDSASNVSARLIAATAETYELLSQQIDSLQKSMEAQGIRVDRIQVVLAGEGAQNQTENQSRSDLSQSGAQQQAFQDLAQQQYRSGQQENYMTSPGGRSGKGPVVTAVPEAEDAAMPGESRNDNGRVSLLI